VSYRGKAGSLQCYHGFDYAPVGLWQLNGNLLDSGPNGFHLSVETGSERYTNVAPGIRGASFDAATKLIYNVTGSALQITGDVTLECIVVASLTTAVQSVVSYSGNTDVAADNFLYSIYTNPPGHLEYFWENAGGVNQDFLLPIAGLPTAQPVHLAAVRSNNVVRFFVNGLPQGSPSSGLTAATGGTAAVFRIGGSGTTAGESPWNGAVASVKVIASALSAAQVKDEYNRTLGHLYGFL
jgi:hypothetical protein